MPCCAGCAGGCSGERAGVTTRAVPPGDISVIVAGTLHPSAPGRPPPDIAACLASIARHLPGAETILSTWCGEAVPGLPAATRLVTQPAPPPLVDANGNRNNLARQVAAVRLGLAHATRPYVLKLRPDLALTSARIATLADSQAARAHPARRFAARVTITTLATRDPLRHPMLFHPSDMVQFGRAEDIRDYWNHPPPPEAWLRRPAPTRNPLGSVAGYTALRMVPEQALCLAWLGRHGIDAALRHPCDGDRARFALSEAVLAANFTLLPWDESGIAFPARFTAARAIAGTLYDAAGIAALERTLARPGRLRPWRYLAARYLALPLRRTWWVSTGAMLLYSLHPALAGTAQRRWRRFTGWSG
jgi:hypothetical protein